MILHKKLLEVRAATNMADLRGDGESIMRISRIVPDFIKDKAQQNF